MSSEIIISILAVWILVLAIGCALYASERNHWKRKYKSLMNEVLAQSHVDTSETTRRLREIGERYDAMANGIAEQNREPLQMTLDEFIDSQG